MMNKDDGARGDRTSDPPCRPAGSPSSAAAAPSCAAWTSPSPAARSPACSARAAAARRPSCARSSASRPVTGTVDVLGRPAGHRRPAHPHRLRHPGAVGLRRPDRPPEPRLLRRDRSAAPPPTRRRPGHRRRSTSAAPPTRSPATSPAASAAASPWPSRCSARPNCWCSTSRRSASTPCCAATCGRCSTGSPRRGTTLLVSSHVMDEAERCDRLLLMREGRSSPTTPPTRCSPAPAPPTSRRPSCASSRGASRRGGARMSHARRTLATAGRVLRQLRHDPRTIALLLVVPALLLDAARAGRLRRQPAHLRQRRRRRCSASSRSSRCSWSPRIATLRERTSGTLERLLAMPLGKGDLIAGYALAFGAARDRPGGRSPPALAVWSSASTSRAPPGCCSWSPSWTPCSAPPSACSSAPSPPPSSRPSSSCRP